MHAFYRLVQKRLLPAAFPLFICKKLKLNCYEKILTDRNFC
jgi:hypothetical protein